MMMLTRRRRMMILQTVVTIPTIIVLAKTMKLRITKEKVCYNNSSNGRSQNDGHSKVIQ